MLSKRVKYALKAILYLAEREGRGPVLISEIAEKEKIPQKFLELILLDLKNAGLLRSKKGKGGGYFLARKASDLDLGAVLRTLEGPLAPVPCVSVTAYRPCEECLDEDTCGIKLVMKEVRDAIAGILDHVTFAEVLERVRKAKSEEAELMYYI
jgi:Rrf2 family protein